MKIAITTDLYHPMTNGVAVFSHNLAEGLARKGHEVMVLCPSFTGKHAQTVREPDKIAERASGARENTGKPGKITTVYLKSLRFPFYPDQINDVPEAKEFLGHTLPRLGYRYGLWITLDPYPEMRRALAKFQPEVIHNQTAEMVAVAARRYAKNFGVPMVSTGHAYPDNITGQMKLIKPIKKSLDAILRAYMMSFLKHSEYATMPTKLAIEDMMPKDDEDFDVPVEALSNGIDLTEFSPGEPDLAVLQKYGLEPGRPRVLYVGRVDPEKSVKNVVLAFSEVAKQVPEAELVVVGDGTDRSGLLTLAEELGLSERVKFPGRVLLPDIAEIYRAGTLFATASKTETQGIVLIEAAASGLPLVAVDAGAVAELCQDGRSGALCQPDNLEEMVAGMLKILQNPAIAQKYSAGSLKIAQAHDLNRTLKRFVEIYNLAIARKGAGEQREA